VGSRTGRDGVIRNDEVDGGGAAVDPTRASMLLTGTDGCADTAAAGDLSNGDEENRDPAAKVEMP
jgi:hypothetical protein